MIVAEQKGRDTKQKLFRNFGMPKPEGYRKALRVMQLAGKFRRPVVTFLDTPGAYPGIDAEERGQAEAIARNRSEEHTSELQSPCNLVCRLLLEKKTQTHHLLEHGRSRRQIVRVQDLRVNE